MFILLRKPLLLPPNVNREMEFCEENYTYILANCCKQIFGTFARVKL